MERQKKNEGITLVSLVVSIIVMLILAGVSINAVVGDNGILTQAQEAALATELARIKEELEYMFLDFNIGDDETSISEFLNSKVADGTIDEFKTVSTGSALQMIVVKDGYYFYVAKSNGQYYATQMETELDNAGEGFVVVTQDSFDTVSGTMSFDAGSGETTVIFYETVSGEMNFDIVSGTVTIYVTQDMTLTNENMSRSAVDVHEGATLKLYFVDGAQMTVDSGYGTSASENVAGEGGYAGIHVPEGATLELYGEGTITAIGGDAGDGGTYTVSGASQNQTSSGAGGGGAGAGIGGNGGNGGAYKTGVGASGYAGENCGIIKIYNSVIVYAYGGAGGSGGAGNSTSKTAGGAGGYPAAGIGRRRSRWFGWYLLCWWRWLHRTELEIAGEEASENGLAGIGGPSGSVQYEGGGGYFEGGEGLDTNGLDRQTLCFAGFYNQGSQPNITHKSGSGGTAGEGGNIMVSSSATVYAYNGNLYTDGTSYENGLNQCPIYLQAGYVVAQYEYVESSNTDTITFTLSLISSQSTVTTTGYSNTAYDTVSNDYRYITKNSVLTNVDMSTQGIGSGAGYIEVSNGTYTVDSSMN